MQRDRKILSIDGSGFRALAQLDILARLMQQVNAERPTTTPEKRPADVFDLICGTAAGGLVAILLGRLGMSCSDARKTYLDLERILFTRTDAEMTVDGTWLVSDLLTSTATFGTRAFQDEIKRVVKRQLGGDETASDTEPRFQMLYDNQYTRSCRTLVTVVRSVSGDRTNANKAYADGDDDAVRIRSYQAPRGNRAPTSTNWTVWQAAIGTAACPQLFSPVDISSELFQGANASGFANPSMIAYLEALDLFGTRSDPPPLTLVSLGMGLRNRHDYSVPSDNTISQHILSLSEDRLRPSNSSGSNPVNEDRLRAFLRQTQLVAVATRVKDLRVANLIRRTGPSQQYFRFDPPRDNRSFVLVDFAQGQTIEDIVNGFWQDRTHEEARQKAVRILRGTWAWQWVELRNHTNDPDVGNGVGTLTGNALDMMDQCHQWEQANPGQIITCFTMARDNRAGEIITGPVQPLLQMDPPSTLYVRILLEDNMRFFPQQSTRNFSGKSLGDDDPEPRSPVDLIRLSTRQTVTAFNSAGWSANTEVDPERLLRNYHRFYYPYEGTWVRKN